MLYVLLLAAGLAVSTTHAYLVWKNKDGVRYSVSEHAIADRKSYLLYIGAHLFADILFVLYAYLFFYQTHNQNLLFGLTIVFVALDIIQSLLPSRGKSESIHFTAAYVSWFLYQLVGVLALLLISIKEPYMLFATILILLIIGMFVYMHFKRQKLWPLQLIMVPLYVLFLLLITVGSS